MVVTICWTVVSETWMAICHVRHWEKMQASRRINLRKRAYAEVDDDWAYTVEKV